jgi:acetyl-CoA carboxylase carboxyl transferase subunit beta
MVERDVRSLIDAVSSGFTEFTVDGERHFDPLRWKGYDESRRQARERSGQPESVICGLGKFGDTEALIIGFDFRFLGGSIGTATGNRIVAAITTASLKHLPLVSLIATGGSRMQEGMRSLLQLQRIAHSLALHRKDQLVHIAVLRDPTTGGVWASLGASADVIIGVAGAQVGFAGSRVRPVEFADDPAYTTEGQLAAGQVDEVVAESELGEVLTEWLELLDRDHDLPDPAPVPRALGELTLAPDGWSAVQRARSATRPRAKAYLDDYFESRRAISGDRCGGVDPGMLCGFGRRDGRTIAYAAQAGTATTPAGFRTATRLIRLAERLELAVLTLVDTPGALADPASERAGLGPAIAELFTAMAETEVPKTTLVIGEGGSGGALALSAHNKTWITPDAYFSVIAPELAAAILKRSPDEVPATADQLMLRPEDLVKLRVVNGIVSG